ncbi:MAG: thioredoxin-disulfide reductase [Spirochaetia bacterium]|nr:thioredoxin-disulfide reductase [Spirochaetia bacterium]
MNTDWDIVIIGSGPAGLTAAQYAARANMKTVILEALSPGGQTLLIDELENYPGFPEATDGFSFSEAMVKQAKKFGSVIEYTGAASVKKENDRFTVETTGNQILTAKAVILATGAAHRPLNVPGEERLSGRGVSYCATCDGPFFRNKKIFVVGGGDTACTDAVYLAKLSDRVTIVHRKDRFRAQKAVADKVLTHPNIRVLFNTEIREIKGADKVSSVVLFNNRDNTSVEEDADAVFIFVGTVPHTEPVPDVEKDESGYIITNASMETSIPGLFCAGDVRATPFRQVVVACGEGAIAAHAAEEYIGRLTGTEYR